MVKLESALPQIDKVADLQQNIDDSMTQMELRIEEKVTKKMLKVEDELKKLCTRDMRRIDTELLILNTNFGTLSTEQRNIDERLRSLS